MLLLDACPKESATYAGASREAYQSKKGCKGFSAASADLKEQNHVTKASLGREQLLYEPWERPQTLATALSCAGKHPVIP